MLVRRPMPLFFFLSVCFINPTVRALPPSGILWPTDNRPAQVAPGETLVIEVRMNLPLTPPPGVQQDKVWQKWNVTLFRDADIGLGGASPELLYRARIIRVRPADTSFGYLFTVQMNPWMAPGRYDLELASEGLRLLSRLSVVVGEGTPLENGVKIVRISPEKFRLENASPKASYREFDVTLIGASGVLVKNAKGAVQYPVFASFSRFESSSETPDGRVLRYAVTVPPALSQNGPADEISPIPGILDLLVEQVKKTQICELLVPLSASPLPRRLRCSTRR